VRNDEVAAILTAVLEEMKGLRACMDMLARAVYSQQTVSQDLSAMNLGGFAAAVDAPTQEPEAGENALATHSSLQHRLSEVWGTGFRPPADEKDAA
jgi:hypothetical protein